MKYLLFLLFVPFYSFASVEVAFIEMRDYDGQVIQLEPNGKYAHMAISYRGNWLHAHPFRGVEVVSKEELEKMGEIKVILTKSDFEALSEVEVARYLGKPYDSEFSWSDAKIYCAELIAKLLGINPLPMSFDAEFWSEELQRMKGLLGLSPDDLFPVLLERGYKKKNSKQCAQSFS